MINLSLWQYHIYYAVPIFISLFTKTTADWVKTLLFKIVWWWLVVHLRFWTCNWFLTCVGNKKKTTVMSTWQVERNWSSFDLLTVQLIKAPYAKIYNIIKTQTMSEGSVDEVTEEHSRTTLTKTTTRYYYLCFYRFFFSPPSLPVCLYVRL